jgi:hypothetical protein
MTAKREVAAAIARDELDEGSGLAAAESALAAHKPFCPLLAEWALAYIRFSVRHPPADLTQWELAVRRIVTLGEENVFPVGYEGSARVLMELGEAFALRNDHVTAFVALATASARLRAGSLTGRRDPTSFATTLDAEIREEEQLAAKQRLNDQTAHAR